MKILLSPAKKMNVNTDDLAPLGLPVFMEQTEEILRFLQDYPTRRLKSCGFVMTGSQNRTMTD